MGIAVECGIQPGQFWRMTPLELRAVLDFKREVARNRPGMPGAGGPSRAERRAWLDDMKRRFPDKPGAAAPPKN